MDCLNSFSFATIGQANYSGSSVKTWTAGAQEYWALDVSQSSYFDIVGFKNINIYGVDVVGTVQTLPQATNGGVVLEDWGVQVFLDGQIPLVSGNIRTTPNQWSITNAGAFAKIFEVGRYSNSFKFSSPFESVKSVSLLTLRANGYGGQTVNNVNIYWNLNFIFHYSYEGE